MLHEAQPYPGDTPRDTAERRFLVYAVSETEYVVMDNERNRDDELILEASRLHDPDFIPSQWYAEKCAKELGLDPSEVPDNDYCYSMGELQDVHRGAAVLMLQRHEMRVGNLPDCDYIRVDCEESSSNYIVTNMRRGDGPAE
ncbi:hypothetical protein B0H17DRAFT_1146589 [Mycena rosella]|uniref:Uncharacterized protein n=1 Tax=Mycena rosella TaxID=1033263 RepID=A0AAD7CNQ7_MYCRO|nr:hypothetical protein B0H17DRAFT_1146589 [Mycena rosella]